MVHDGGPVEGRLPEDLNLTVGGELPGQDPQQCGLAGTVAADESVDETGFQGEGHALQHLGVPAVTGGQIVGGDHR